MTVLTVDQATQTASAAGFQGQARDIIVAIAQAESSLDTQARHVNTYATGPYRNSVDRGILQINNVAWPDCSNECAFDPSCAFTYAFSPISKGGTDFSLWNTYTSGAYKKFLPQGGGSGPSGPADTIMVKNAQSVSEWGSLINGQKTSGGCGEASILMAIHVLTGGKLKLNSQLVTEAMNLCYYSGQASVNGSMGISNGKDGYKWLFNNIGPVLKNAGIQDNIPSFSTVNAIADWRAQLTKNRGKIPLVINMAHVRYGLGTTQPKNANIDGHSICIMGYNSTTGHYFCGDPNTDEATRGELVQYTFQQLSDSQPFSLYVPSDDNILSQWLAAAGSFLSHNGITDAISGVLDIGTAIQNLANAITGIFTWQSVKVANIIYHEPGFLGICETIDEASANPFKNFDWSQLANPFQWIQVAWQSSEFFTLRVAFVSAGLLMVIGAIIMLSAEEIGAVLGAIFGDNSGAKAAGVGKVAEIVM